MRDLNIRRLFVLALFLIASIIFSVEISEAGRRGGEHSSHHNRGHDEIEGVVERLVVSYDRAVVKPASGKSMVFKFDPPREVDLLTLGPGASYDILGEFLAEGDYKWIRLSVEAKKDTLDSYVEISGDEYSIWMPNKKKGHSGEKGHKRGLKLEKGFHVSSDGMADFSVAFELSKNTHRSKRDGHKYGDGDDVNFMLRPRLRLIESAAVEVEVEEPVLPGSISGTVALPFLTDATCINRKFAVYLFSGFGVTPDDEDGNAPYSVATAPVLYASSLFSYAYSFGSLDPGAYTLAYTCQVYNDLPLSDDVIIFSFVADVSVVSGTETVVNIQ